MAVQMVFPLGGVSDAASASCPGCCPSCFFRACLPVGVVMMLSRVVLKGALMVRKCIFSGSVCPSALFQRFKIVLLATSR